MRISYLLNPIISSGKDEQVHPSNSDFLSFLLSAAQVSIQFACVCQSLFVCLALNFKERIHHQDEASGLIF
jgi:hypothetical protein